MDDKNMDVLVGVFVSHTWDEVKTWATSINDVGFTGEKIAVVYDVNEDVVERLYKAGFTVIRKDILEVSNRANIVTQRFFDVWEATQGKEGRLITTDVADVVFQRNPSEELDNLVGVNIVASGENLRYEAEPWSKNNMIMTYGENVFEHLSRNEIRCAGVIAGEMNSVRNLCQDIYIACQTFPSYVSGGGGPDQAAYNNLLKEIDYIPVGHNYPWAAHMGTTIHAVKAGTGQIGREYMLSSDKKKYLTKVEDSFVHPDVKIEKDGTVTTSDGRPFAIVHQYNRVPELVQKYRNVKTIYTSDTMYYKAG